MSIQPKHVDDLNHPEGKGRDQGHLDSERVSLDSLSNTHLSTK